MKRLRRRAFAKASGFTYKKWNDGSWGITTLDNRLGLYRTEPVSDSECAIDIKRNKRILKL